MTQHLRRPWPLLVALALLAAVLPARARAGLPPALTITGSRMAYAVLTVTERTTYRLDHAVADYRGGRWAGFAIGADWPTVWSEHHAHDPVLRGRAAREADGRLGVGVLEPGRYRVYLFADGQPVTVRLPWSGPNVRLAPDAPLDARIAADHTVVAGQDVRLAVPQDGGAGTVTAATAYWQKAQPSLTYEVRVCFARPPATWASCDKPLGWERYRDDGSNSGLVRAYPLGGVPRRHVTSGRSYLAEVAGPATGLLTVLTLRYRPAAHDLRRLPIGGGAAR